MPWFFGELTVVAVMLVVAGTGGAGGAVIPSEGGSMGARGTVLADDISR